MSKQHGLTVDVIIDTPRGSRNKYKFDKKLSGFRLAGVLPAGHSFPYDFGSVPGTKGEDGDAIDVLVLMEEPAFVGCHVKCRLIGGIRANQTEEDGRVERNDRLLAVARKSIEYSPIDNISELTDELVTQIEHFFISYNDVKGKKFEPNGRFGPDEAADIVGRSRKVPDGSGKKRKT
ncbi:MAG: inorganic diphosphatase [Pyrinomonadaceae bacterium]